MHIESISFPFVVYDSKGSVRKLGIIINNKIIQIYIVGLLFQTAFKVILKAK